MGRGKKPASYEDIEALPEGWVGEILEDELMASPRPALGHARTASWLAHLVMGPFDEGRGGPGGWWFVNEPELHLGRDVLVPDVAGWRRERLPRLPAAEEPFMTLAPDWVCEVLSPRTAVWDRARKLPRYHREGVGHVWLVDPRQHTLEVFRRGFSSWRPVATFAEHAAVRAEPFEAVALELGRLWLQRGTG